MATFSDVVNRGVGIGVLAGGLVLLAACSGQEGSASSTPSLSADASTTVASLPPVATTTPPPTTTTTTTTRPPTHTVHATKAAPPALTCTASVDDPHPHHNERIEIIVHTKAGAEITATAHYKTTDTTHETTASGSTTDVEFDISRATYGHSVPVDVSVSRAGSTGSCETQFVPEP